MNKLYKIKAITNMHVGSGDLNYSIVDNQVQRDSITEYPIINGSSLKGALRSHFEKKLEIKNVKNIFGDIDSGKGTHRFFSANILSIPVRSNEIPFYNGTSVGIIKNFINQIGMFNLKINQIKVLKELVELDVKGPIMFEENENNVYVENFKVEYKKIENILELENIIGKNIILFDDKSFKEISEQLPVIARNKLENGKSKNLWYEEVVPKESIFYTVMINDKDTDTDLEKYITEDIIQIGGNASIGYGYTKFELLSGDINE
jgi:CRISPR-associated protein Cmr4